MFALSGTPMTSVRQPYLSKARRAGVSPAIFYILCVFPYILAPFVCDFATLREFNFLALDFSKRGYAHDLGAQIIPE